MRKRKSCLLLEPFILFFAIIVAVGVCFYISNKNTINYNKPIETTSNYVHSREAVEENARSLIDLYKSDFAIFAKNKDTNTDVAEEARIRINSTAIFYNKYIQSNSYLWENDNFPDGILPSLPILK